MENALVNLTIDGKAVTAKKGANLLQVARDNGVDIPSLCWLSHLTPSGSCRMCIVKVEGIRGLKTACTLTAEEGMQVIASDEEIEKTRRTTLELLLAEHNFDCSICDKNGECELQDLAYRFEISQTENRSIHDNKISMEHFDDSSPVLNYDPSRCVRCGRCIQACEDVQGKSILSFVERGEETYVSPEFGKWGDSRCDGCGECVQSCPTAALTEKPLTMRIRKFDIDRTVRTTCSYCGVGCQMDLWIKDDKIVRVRGVHEDPNDGRLCVKGRFGYEFVSDSNRLTKPLIRKNGELVESSWDEALNLIASKLNETKEKYGARSIAGLASARCTNEDNYVFQKFFRAVVQTNSVDHCARLCHAPTVAGLGRSFGSGAMTNSIAELADADCILVTGTNVTETHPVTGTYVKNAIAKGAKLIVVDPRKIDIVKHSTIWMRQKLGTDVAWINGMLNVIISEGLADENFIKERTENYEELKKTVEAYSPEKVEEISGIPAEQLREAARLYATSKRSSIVYAMGITQHITGTDNVLSLANLALATGQIGRRSTGINPLRGQNNVQGACDLGGLPNVFSGYQKVTDPAAQEKMKKAWGVNKLDTEDGLTVVEIMNAAEKGEVKSLYIMGENPMLSDPNLGHVEEALKKLDFLVVQDIFPTETTQFADVVLPAASFAEKEGTFTNSGRRILRVRKAVPAPGEARGDWEIIADLSRRMGYEMDWYDSDEVMQEIASLTPQYGGVSYKRLETETLQWPCPDKKHTGTPYLHKGKFARGLGKFHAVDWIPPAEHPDDEYPMLMSTGRMLFHYHTATMTRKSTPLNSYAPEAYVEIHAEDLIKIGAKSGDKLKVTTRRGEIVVPAKESDRVDRGVIFIPFHFHESPANRLTNDVLDPKSKIPELKVSACRVELA